MTHDSTTDDSTDDRSEGGRSAGDRSADARPAQDRTTPSRTAPGPAAYGRMAFADRVRLTARLARRLARSRALARSVVIVFVAGLLVMGMFVTLRTLSLSGEQVAQNELVRFGAKVGYGSGVSLPPGDDTFLADLRSRMRDADATDAEIVLSATDVQLNTTPARNVTALESDWTSRPYPERYELLSGHESDTFPPGEALLRTVDASGTLDGLRRTEPRYLMDDDPDNPRMASREGGDGSLLAADTPADVERLIGRRLDSAQTSVLRDGGLLVWAHTPDAPTGPNAHTSLVVRQGDKILGSTAELPEASVEVSPAEWRTGSDGIMLRATATALDLPIQAHGPIMVTGVTDTESRALQQAVVDAGRTQAPS
ncbi:hypothetical protein RM704_24720 [Streptomyces sp. DSM 3412]|uniref:ABC transporter permease n=1 Tax=Streptomyces gottesmaniae TaxID=3075518 RepID=A0ABU2Z339_9ACTN|nr:hypothetical protein [Streptomyces sp. DSM 3412]MDT0570621.1 hypothetical protein [Streptomyces sp. DSM 3412]